MSLPPVTPTTIALNNSSPGTIDLFGRMILGVGIRGAVIRLGTVLYNKATYPTNTLVTGGTRRTRCVWRNGTHNV